MAGRRSSSIGCRSLISRRASVYVNSYDPVKLIVELNMQLAAFRDLLIHIGQPSDSPEWREKIRKGRRSMIDSLKGASKVILPQVRSVATEGVPVNNPNLQMLYYVMQMFVRELQKCHRLVKSVPMDMTGYYENRAGPSNIGNVISQILLCKTITPDFLEEELNSITKDTQDTKNLMKELEEYMAPQEDNIERSVALTDDPPSKWTNKRRRNSFYKNLDFLCCVRRSN